jgi:probable F420-dependent oxidoreductase
MRIGLTLPHYGFSLPEGRSISFEELAAHAVEAERLGFDSVWISDHFFYSIARYGGAEGVHGSLEPLTSLAALAPLTQRVRLGTLVLCAPFRHPAILAKSATTIDLLSGGRFDLGIGAGWYEDEFRAFGYAFPSVGERFSILEDTVEVLDALLPGGPVVLQARRFTLRDAYNRPEPSQRPRPPIWVGSKGGDRALRLVARHADGWNTVWRWTPEAYGEKVRRARELCELEGRDPQTLRLSLGLYAIVGEDERDLRARWDRISAWVPGVLAGQTIDGWRRDALVGTPEQVAERVEAFADLGVEETVVAPAPLPFAVPDRDVVRLVAEALIAGARHG